MRHYRRRLQAGQVLLRLRVVPVSLPGGYGVPVALESMLEVVENCKLIPRHDIRVGMGLYFVPKPSQRMFQDVANVGVQHVIWSFPGNLQCLGNSHLVIKRAAR